MTQRELAAQVGVNHTYLSKLETGHADTMPSLSLVWALADWLHTDRERLAMLAGYIPDDVMDYLCSNPAALQAVRRLAELAE
jgi:transcriptional regulator with XRE-family HTH domain